MYNTHFLLATALLAPLALGASIPLAIIHRQALTPAPDLPYQWSYKGCYVDRVGKRALYRAMTSSAKMSGGLCARWCSEQGYTFAGTEWSRECFCGYDIFDPVPTQEVDCNWPCSDPDAIGEACGGSQRLSVYELDPKFAQIPTTSPGSGSFPSLGCYSDNIAGRALSVRADVGDGGLTVERCTAACAAQGFAIAGVEYGQECYCGNALENGSESVGGEPELSGCNTVCTGNTLEFCGGPNRLNLYGALPAATPTPTPEVTPEATSTPTPTPEAITPSVVPEVTPTPDPTPAVLPEATPVPEVTPEAPAATPEVTPEATPEVQPPVVETPAVETPAVETPAKETTPEATPTVEAPSAAETPAVETPVVNTPVADTPVAETPAAETTPEPTPVAEAPADESTPDATPDVHAPAVETPVVDSTPAAGVTPEPTPAVGESSSSTSTITHLVTPTPVADSVSLE